MSPLAITSAVSNPDRQSWPRTGHPEMDRQHDVLFALIEQVHALSGPEADVKEMYEALGAFSDAALDRFAYEQELMSRTGFPDYARHRADHRAITAGIVQLIEAIEVGQSPTRAFSEVLARWQRHHIGGLDQDLAKHVLAADARRP